MQMKIQKNAFTELHNRGDNLAAYEVDDCEDDSDSYGDDGDDGDNGDDGNDEKPEPMISNYCLLFFF